MSQPLHATIVMPLKSQQDHWLCQSLNSALEQTVATEVLVVTSQATPESNRAILQQATAKNSNLRTIERPRGAGFAQAINLGFDEARTKRVGLLLTDDWLADNAVEKCLKHDADIVATARVAHAADGIKILWKSTADQARFDTMPTLQERASYVGHFILFQRAAVLAVGGVDPEIGLTGADDYDLIWTMLENNATVKLIPDTLYHYRDHDGERLTMRAQHEQIHDLRKILAKHGVAPEETERLVASKARWYGVPCHFAIDHPDWYQTTNLRSSSSNV